MSTDFDQLIADIDLEAHHEGPQALRELAQLRDEFGLASQMIQSRRESKLSQRELAKLSGVPQSEISASRPARATPPMPRSRRCCGPWESVYSLLGAAVCTGP